jgi:Tol biopolymer transport system component
MAAAGASNEPMGRTRSRARLGWLVAGILGVALIAAIGVTLRVSPGEPAEPTMFTISAPENTQLDQDPQFAVSPDGRHLALVASSNGVSKLWLKSRASPVATPMPGTEGAIYPFWSPDNQYVAYFASGRLWKVRIGGRPEEICKLRVGEQRSATGGRGGTWNRNDEIIFAPGGPLLKVSAGGGATVAVTALDKSRRDTVHRFPHFLPDGRSFLYWAGGGPTSGDIQIGSLDSRESVMSTGIQGTLGLWGPVMFSSGHVLYVRDFNLVAQPFDLATRQLKGETVSLANDVTSFSVSAAGVLAHATPTQAQLTWLDRAGNTLGTVGGPSAHSASFHNFMVALSPDERHVATSTRIGSPGNQDIVLFDLARPTDPPRRFTSDTGTDYFPVWSPDGKEVVFTSTRGGRGQIYRRAVDFSNREEIFHASVDKGSGTPTDWSRDGKYLAYTAAGGIWILPLSGARTPFPFRESPVVDRHAHFSPDVRWVAFTSQESGTGRQVYVAPFPGKGPVQQVSARGGTQPMWHPNGKELFFLAPDDGLMSVAFETERTFKHEQPRKLFTVRVNQYFGAGNEYAVSKDGSRFLVNVLPSPKHITVVLDWLTLTKR